MAGGYKFLAGRGRAQVEISADWFEPFDRVLQTVAPMTREVMTEETRELFENAQQNWPVKLLHSYERDALIDPDSSPQLIRWIKRKERQRRPRGIGNYSKGALEHGWRVFGETIEVFIRNQARNQGRPYAHYITKPWPENNVKVANELLYKPGRKLGRKLAEMMGRELASIAKKAA